MNYNNVPKELRLYNQWVAWRLEWKADDVEHKEKPTKVPYQTNGYQAKITNPQHWNSFQEIVKIKLANDKQVFNHANPVLQTGFSGIGFCLSKMDPFTGIDLDHTDNQEEFDRQLKIYNNFNSYSEISPSGQGLRIFCFGNLLQGRRRANIEIYSEGRFLSVTGDVYNPAPIAHRQELLDILWAEMGAPAKIYQVKDKPQTEDDATILKRASDAVNGEKFMKLFQGDWTSLYPSQSEADFSIIDMFAFYTQNVEQITRLFHMSQLGKRDKAKRPDYLNYMINKAFDRQLPEIDLEGLKAQFEANGVLKLEGATAGKTAAPSVPLSTGKLEAQAQPGSGANDREASTNSSAATANLIAKRINVNLAGKEPPWPPGLLGQIASFIYHSSHYPCYEIALAGAIGLMAGICGRTYNVSGTGLNLYIVFLAVTGIGKEAASAGITKIMAKVKKSIPQADTFVGPSDIRSEQALVKYLNDNKSFVSIYSEFGLKLKQMNNNRSANDIGLRSILLKLYNKSGFNDELGKIIYSDKDKNTKDLKAPAFTLLGESTPEEYYTAIDENLIADGFLNRFLSFEYKGKRPDKNKKVISEPSAELEFNLCNLIANCLAKDADASPINVEITPEAKVLFEEIDNILTDHINGESSELLRKLWVRASVKAMKLAALPAIGINHIKPVIDYNCAKWACDIVTKDTNHIASKFDLGEVGEESSLTYSSDINQLNDMIKVIKKWITKEEKPQRADDKMLASGVYAFSSLQQRVYPMSSYRKDKYGSTAAFKRAIQALLDNGDIKELNPVQVEQQFGKKAKCFVVVDYNRFVSLKEAS